MNLKSNIAWYLTAVLIFVLLYWWHSNAYTNSLGFLLVPVAKTVGFVTGSGLTYIEGTGYFIDRSNIILEKSCSGFNFWILCFIMLYFLVLNYFEAGYKKLLAIPVIFLIAYVLALLVNSSRIILSIIAQNSADTFMVVRPHLILHDGIGIFINLFFLVIFYMSSDYFLNKTIRSNAQPV